VCGVGIAGRGCHDPMSRWRSCMCENVPWIGSSYETWRESFECGEREMKKWVLTLFGVWVVDSFPWDVSTGC
jgi:hypothetical protein